MMALDKIYTAELIISDPQDLVQPAPFQDELQFDDNGVLLSSAPAAPAAPVEPERKTLTMSESLGPIIWGLADVLSRLPDTTAVHSLVVVDDDRRPILRCSDPVAFSNALLAGQSGDISRFESLAAQLHTEVARLTVELQESEDRTRSTVQDANAVAADLQTRLDQATAELSALRAGDNKAETTTKKTTAGKQA